MGVRNHLSRPVRRAMAVAVMSACASSAFAIEFETDGGWRGSVNTTVSASSSWRVEGRDLSLLWPENAAMIGIKGASGGALTDDGNLNYDKGDRYSTMFKFISDLNISKGDTGALVRIKGWYDQVQNDESVPWGNANTGYANESRRVSRTLSDAGFDPLAKFDGLYLLDAYAYSSFDMAGNPLQVRLGRQAVNWGESLFVQGLNQLTPLDIIALRRAGTEIKEALLPVWSIYGNLGLPGGISAEGFYQLKWEPSAIDSCGTYWAPTDSTISTAKNNCNRTNLSVTGVTNDLITSPIPAILGIEGKDAKNSGQWGLALRIPVESIDTEIGLYAMNIHSRVPIISGIYGGGATGLKAAEIAYVTQLATAAAQKAGAAAAAAAVAAGNAAGAAAAAAAAGAAAAKATQTGVVTGILANNTLSFWEYPENIMIFGISASTNIAGWSTGWELSYQKDVPVQLNGNDMLQAAISGVAVAAAQKDGGPLEYLVTGLPRGGPVQGYQRFNKTQFQGNGVYILPAMAGATSGLFIAEAAFQWNNIPTSTGANGQPRFGRAFIFGNALTPTLNRCDPATGTSWNRQADGCSNQGFVDDFAWGYRIKASLDYAGIFDTSWTVTPSVFFAHDVKGYSMDSQFTEGKKTVSLGLKFSLNKVHNVEVNYTTYSNSAKFDMFRDRDNVSVGYNYTF